MMTTTRSDAIETTVQKTNEWLAAIAAALGEESDRHLAYGALRAVLHALRDRLPEGEVVDLGAQLPMLIRGLYYEGWSPREKPSRIGKDEFLDAIDRQFAHRLNRPDAEIVARTVLRVLAEHTSAGEVKDLKAVLPKPLRELVP